jgi:predicted transcriptional regulator
MGNTIRTKKQKTPYTSISRVLLQDPRLTFEARGLASYLLSKPDNWEIDVDALIRESPAGRDAIYRIIKELCNEGYLIREKYRERGKFKYDYTLYETRELAAKHHFIGDDQPSLFDQYGKPIRQSRTGEENPTPDSHADDSPDLSESADHASESQSSAPESGSEAANHPNQCAKPVLETSTDNQHWKPVLETSTGKPDWSCKEEQTSEQNSEQISEQTTEQQGAESAVVVVVCPFSEQEVLAYARSQANIENPVGFSKSVRDGTAKDLPRILQSIGEWWRDHAPPESEPAATSAATDAGVQMPGELVPELLEKFLLAVGERVNPTSFRTWFAPIAAMSRGDTVVYLQVPHASFAGWISGNYSDIVGEALEAIGLAGYRFEFIVQRE